MERLLLRLETGLGSLTPAEVGEVADVLASPAADPFRGVMVELATRRTRQGFDRCLRLYAPLYLSSVCTNRCCYCGFRQDNPVPRVTLTARQIDREAEILRDRGFEEVLLLTGELARGAGVPYLAEAVDRARAFFADISLEVFAMDTGDYARMTRAGASGLTIYQETYDAATYRRVHRGGPKRRFLWRLGAPHRAAEGGLTRLGIGALFGLSDWRYETAALCRHAAVLREDHPSCSVAVSFPRLRPAGSSFTGEHPVADAELVHAMAIVRLSLPSADLVLSTREPPALRDWLAARLITKLSAGSSTEPGGYGDPGSVLAQFEIEDRRDRPAIVAMLERAGLRALEGRSPRELFGARSVE